MIVQLQNLFSTIHIATIIFGFFLLLRSISVLFYAFSVIKDQDKFFNDLTSKYSTNDDSTVKSVKDIVNEIEDIEYDDDYDYLPATHVENMLIAGFIVFMVAMTVMAIKLWY